MEAGELQEFDIPHILLQNSNGIFTDMVKKTGPGTSEALRKIAKDVSKLYFLLRLQNDIS